MLLVHLLGNEHLCCARSLSDKCTKKSQPIVPVHARHQIQNVKIVGLIQFISQNDFQIQILNQFHSKTLSDPAQFSIRSFPAVFLIPLYSKSNTTFLPRSLLIQTQIIFSFCLNLCRYPSDAYISHSLQFHLTVIVARIPKEDGII